ncbi:exodeoxyribonuclease V subunit gamma [Geomonas sp. RF6]|uniref:exodeoxyribonuclease V subunit gamma n=1 Tax=Geomonas sp. RF6 TaxID=2897342 RepID=UPI001E4C322D|nr:exodeoxyribonuclease V subunit gamma [Geomonas sp. RF6]UFS70145.1 exodeoxyribonuclease V subunit gamma [Geomonas sp. RF6]
MPLKIYTSNRMENLVDALSGVLAKPLSSPFAPEFLVVQSKGMERWAAMELAKRLGIWANCKYFFPKVMVWELFRKTLPNLSETSFFNPDLMAWKIMMLLPLFLNRPEFAPLRHYLRDDRDGLKRFQLAGKIAGVFEEYTVFRPDLLLSWEGAEGGDWQEILWREVARCGNGQHRARLKEDFLKLLAEGEIGRNALPERITVFGISYLPNYHMDLLAQVAEHRDVHLFLLSPCREYWVDIVSAREKARRAPEAREYLVEGNPLLASLGRLARDFSNTVISCGAVSEDTDLYEDPGSGTLLAALQSDVLNLRGREGDRPRRTIAPDDASVQIHSCHSRMREIEVLHDNLLSLLDKDPTLNCWDIVVMTTDIERYAPYISMVFDGCQDPARRIPFSIADRNLSSQGVVAAALLKLLALPGTRLTVTSVFDILESLPVRTRFDLEAQELDLVRSWIEDTRIRWGVDEEHRAGLGLPPYRDNSWRAGLDRLLLGYAMPEEGHQLFNGILPYDEMEGGSAETLGKFAEFVRRVVKLCDILCRKRSLREWGSVLKEMIADFVETGDDLAHEVATVNRIVQSLEEAAARTSFAEEVDLSVIRSWISSRLSEAEQGVGFLTGGVTFCAMVPMRSIPFSVVALVGMSDNAFPPQSRSTGFDLIAQDPQRGDRSARDEYRYLFLECLLSARKYLYMSYVGQSIKDNSTIPPSVVVSEFLDAVEGSFEAPGRKVEERLVTKHRLQAFSRSYFDGSGLFSYSTENCDAVKEAAAAVASRTEFISAPLKEPPREMREVDLLQLVRFFANPARFLLENRLEIRLEDVATPLPEREVFAVDGLDAYGLNQELLEKKLAGAELDPFCTIARCRGLLPPARHGEIVFADAVAEVESLVEKIEEQCAGQKELPPFVFDEVLGDFRLSGRVGGIWSKRKIVHRCANLKAKDEIKGWIEHLALNAFAPEGYPRESIVIMKNAVVTFAPVENAAELLASLLECYWEGLKMPLRFFPTSSMEYVCRNGDVEMARKKWETGFYKGEEEDPHFQLCFGQEEDPLDESFERLAQELLGPLVQHRS